MNSSSKAKDDKSRKAQILSAKWLNDAEKSQYIGGNVRDKDLTCKNARQSTHVNRSTIT